MKNSSNHFYSVTQVNTYIKNMFTMDYLLQLLTIKGEVSNCKYHSSGHIYFTLKDKTGSLACVMFASSASRLGFKLSDGQDVLVTGNIDVYERDGKYQCYAKSIKLDGVGLLYEKFEQLKIKLKEMGMFDPLYKQAIPRHIKTLGIVTAPTGAAVRDIINVAHRRNPYLRIILYPALVQGDSAPESIVSGIHFLEKLNVDVMIVGRGGGSIEDLWAFNEEIVAQAVFQSSIPIISAVGHETDTTIIDYVSDLRAPTPSAAAELAVTDIMLVINTIVFYEERLKAILQQKLNAARDKTLQYERLINSKHPQAKLREQKMHVIRYEERLYARIKEIIKEKKHELLVYNEKLKGLSPLHNLEKGLGYVSMEDKCINSISNVEKGDLLHIRLADGLIHARVEGKERLDVREQFRDK